MSLPNRRFSVGFRSENEDQNFNIGAFDNGDQLLTLGFGSIQTVAENDYDRLENKPQINGVELSGDKSGVSLGLINRDEYLTNAEIDEITGWHLSEG